MTSTLTPDAAPSSAAARGIRPVSMSRYDTDFQGFSDDLGASFKRYGFAVIADHGLDEAVIDAAIAAARPSSPCRRKPSASITSRAPAARAA